MRTNRKHLRAVWQKNRKTLLQYDNVIGVAYGPIESGGKLTGEEGIIALVNKKVPVNELPKGQIIPKTVDSYRVNVREPRLNENAQRKYLQANGIETGEIDCLIDHFFLDDAKIHAHNLKRLASRKKKKGGAAPGDVEPGDINTAVMGEIFVIEDDGTLEVDGTIDHIAAYNLFRAEFGDHYDFVFFHYDTGSGVSGQGNSSPTIYNTITGLNHYKGDAYDDRASWDSTKIQSIQKISGLTQVRRMLHETAHRWCSYVNHREGGVSSDNLHEAFADAGQKPYHWGSWFDNNHSCMDYDYYDWKNSATVPGEFEKEVLTYGAPGTDEFNYHELDLYLMGLIDKTEVGNFRYIEDPTDDDGDGSFAGAEVTLDIDDVIAEEGARNPAYPDTQRVYHQAYILITRDLAGIGALDDTATVLGNMERYRKGLTSAFREYTRSRGMIDTSLLHANYSSLYVRDNETDTGADSSTGKFWDSPDIWVRDDDDGGVVHEPADSTKDNFIHVKVWNSSGDDYDDVTVKVYVANFAGTEFYFPDDWHPDIFIGEATVSVPAGSSAVAKVTWPKEMIPDETWHPCVLAEVIPMEVTPEGRHHVWDNKKLAQKNISIVYPPSDGEPLDVAFMFGNKNNGRKSRKVLSVVQSVNRSGLRLSLDTGGATLGEYSNAELYQNLSRLQKPKDGASGDQRGYCDDGLEFTFCDDTKIIMGRNKMTLTILKGSSFRISDHVCCGGGGGKMHAPVLDGKRYTLPDDGIVSYSCSMAEHAFAKMRLLIDTSGVSDAGNLRGLISIVQSDENGRIEGGIDIRLGDA
jgi:hypothetical protein